MPILLIDNKFGKFNKRSLKWEKAAVDHQMGRVQLAIHQAAVEGIVLLNNLFLQIWLNTKSVK